ncbi:MAG: T9SS type A sorting domain-containing protein [Candidatus Kapabacteria bacterium]|nr:T9SS type A sorting domain-containing protein [Candidatus Kapabacteria bacterium]
MKYLKIKLIMILILFNENYLFSLNQYNFNDSLNLKNNIVFEIIKNDNFNVFNNHKLHNTFIYPKEPEIEVNDYNFGKVDIDNLEPIPAKIRIYNISIGNDLNIFGMSQFKQSVLTSDFNKLYPNISRNNPLNIQARKYIEFNIYFKPTSSIKYIDTIIFTSDARKSDSLMILEGEGFKDIYRIKLSTNIFDWGVVPIFSSKNPNDAKLGLDSNNNHIFTLINESDSDIVVNNIKVYQNSFDDFYQFLLEDTTKTIDEIGSLYSIINIPKNSKLTKKIYFKPRSIGKHEVQIVFNYQQNQKNTSIFLKGIGVEPTLDIETDNNSNKLTIIQNPVKDRLYIKTLEFKGNEKVQIINILGINLLEFQIKDNIDISLLVSGVYFLKIENKIGSTLNRVGNQI